MHMWIIPARGAIAVLAFVFIAIAAIEVSPTSTHPAAAPAPLPEGKEPPARPRRHGPFESSCVQCHLEMDDSEESPAVRVRQDVHFEAGLNCSDCHGGNAAAGFDGDMDAAHDEGWAAHPFRGRPARADIPLFCARCHGDPTYMKRFDPQARVDQHGEYVTSVHGKRLAAGDLNVATCADCHGVHGVLAVKDPRAPVHPTRVAETCSTCHSDRDLMAPYGRRGDPYADYSRSVHADALYKEGDLSAPTCNDCHGSHGAVPPGVDSVANVCGSCHAREATLFREAEMANNTNLEACIQCAVCHTNHAIMLPTTEMLGTGPGSTCVGCHLEGEPGWIAAERMKDSLEGIGTKLAEAYEILERAERAGVEIGPDRFALHEADDNLVEARVLVHSFDLERFEQVASKGLAVAEEGIAAGHRAFSELRTRRIGLGLSLIVIFAVIGGLVMVIRRIES